MAAALKISEDDLRERLSKSEASIEERQPAPFHFSFSFGGIKAMRSAAKACLVLWATLVGNEEVNNARYDEVRRYVNGKNDAYHIEKTELDSRPFEKSDALAARYGPMFSLLYVKSDTSGRVIGHFTVFNLIGFWIVLAEAGAPSCRQTALISDPITGRWSDQTMLLRCSTFRLSGSQALTTITTPWIEAYVGSTL